MSFRKSEYFKTTRITVVFAVVAIAISIIVLSGWVFNIDVLTSIGHEWVSLKVNAAIGAIFAASSLLMSTSGKKKKLAFFLAAGTYLIGIVTLSEYLFDWDAHIDELLFQDTKTPAHLYPGRMAPLAAIGFILLSISLLLFHYKRKKLVTDFFAIIVLTVSFLALIGYIYNAKSFYTITYFNSISVSATLVLFFLSLAILFSKPESGLMAVFSEKTRPVMLGARQILSLIITLLVFGWLCLKGYEAEYYDMQFGISVMVVTFSIIIFFTSTAGIRNLNTIENERDRLFKANEEKATEIKDVFERVSDAFMALDKNWRFVYVNKKAGELSKRNPADIIGKNIWEEFPDAVGSDTYMAYHKAMADQQYTSNTDYNGLLELWYESNIYPSPEGLSIFIRDINEIKKAEKALEESANHLRTIYETEPECIKLLGHAGELLEMNPAGLAMIEADNLEMVKGKSLLGIIAPKYRDAFARLTQNVFKGESGILEFEITGLKGTYRFLETHAVPLKDDSGKIISLLSVTRDITERQKAKEAILKSERRYQTLAEVSPVGIFHTDENGNTTYVNPSWCQISGMSFENALGNGWFNAVHEEDKKVLRSSWQQATENQELSLSEYRFVRPDGTIAWVMGQAIPERDLENKIVGYVGTTTDITERKLAEEKLRKSEKRLSEITASIPGVVYQFAMYADGRAVFIFLSDGVKKYLDVNVEDIYKDSSLLFSKVHPDDIGRLLSAIALSNKTLEPLTIVYRILIKEGRYIWVRSDSIPVLLKEGTVLRNGSLIDITATKEAEEELNTAHKQLLFHVENAPLGFIEWDNQLFVKSWSKKAEEIFGWSEREFSEKQKNGLSLVYEEDVTGMRIVAGQLMSGIMERNSITHRNYTKDGRVIWCEWFNSVLKDKEGKVITIMSLVQDVTKRKEAEEAVQRSEANLKEAQRIAHIGSWYLDFKNPIVWSDETYRIYGVSPETFHPNTDSILQLTHPDDQKAFQDRINAFKDGENPGIIETRILLPDGSVRYISGRGDLKVDSDGKPISITGTVQDITERKKAENELEESYKSIRRLTEYLQEVREEERTYIAREIHDELGQQLTVMMMDVAWLNKKIGTENAGVGDKIKELLEMLDNMVKTVRRISTELRPSVLDDLGLVPAIEMHLKDFETRSAILTQLTVPKQDLELADPVKNTLFRIFQESLTNVARHSGAKKVAVKLELENNIIVLIIEDNGIGFDEQKAATKRTLGVLGMKERAAVIGGEYNISGERGKGTIIKVKVPLHN